MCNHKIWVVLLFFLNLSCVQTPKGESVSNESDSIHKNNVSTEVNDSTNQNGIGISQFNSKRDTLSKDEAKILSLVSKENEFIVTSKEIERFYEPGTSILLFSKLIFPKKELEKSGYVNFELIIQGDASSQINLNYNYNMGQASHGFGYVIGDDTNNYLHSIKSCGISSCIVQVFDTGRKLVEKEIPN